MGLCNRCRYWHLRRKLAYGNRGIDCWSLETERYFGEKASANGAEAGDVAAEGLETKRDASDALMMAEPDS